MLTLAETIERDEQAYAYITFTVSMAEMTKPADEGFSQLFAFLAKEGIEPTGAPFYNYRRINMADTLDVEAGVPVARTAMDEGDVRFGTLPAGRFAAIDWHGPYDGLITATAMLLGWAQLTEQPIDMREEADGDHFVCRLEIYETDPSTVKESSELVSKLRFKLAD